MPVKDVLIKNACVITGRGPVFPDGFVHLAAGRVVALGASARAPAMKGMTVIDAGGCYVLPGFINPHMHLYSALARGISVGRMKTFGKVLEGLWWKLDRALSPEDIYVSAALGAVDAIKSGVTTLIDHHASYGAIGGSLGAVTEAMSDVGIRGSTCFEISDRRGRPARDEAVAESGLYLETIGNYVEDDPDFMFRGMVGLHASMTLSDASLGAARELMDMYGVGAHVHVEEGIEDLRTTGGKFGRTPIERLVEKGILRKGSLAIHCVHASDGDIELLRKCGTYVVHNPMSNLNNAVGIAPVLKMCGKGIPVAIGTDGMSAGVAGDIRLAAVLHKVGAGDAQAGWNEIMDAVWGVAPGIASEMFGMDIGVLRKGAAADVIIVDAVPPTPVTEENAWGHVLFGVLNSRVKTTIVGGDVRMRDFRLIGIDESALAKQAQKLAKRLWKRMTKK